MKKLNVRFKNDSDFLAWKSRVSELIDISRINKNTVYYNLSNHYSRDKKPKPKSKINDNSIYYERMKYWRQMPHYHSDNIYAYAHIVFEYDENDISVMEIIAEQKITNLTKSIYIPKLPRHAPYTYKRIIGDEQEKNKYPIYIVSKSRPNQCYTSFHLSLMEVEHFVVVEPDQMQMYRESTLLDFRYAKLLEMDMKYKDEYDTFDDLGDTKSKGPGAARNFAWDHSMIDGHAFHWVFDDNAMGGFFRFDNNERIKIRSSGFFRVMESFVERFDNIAQAGMNYRMFIIQDQKYSPYVTNTRIYSFILNRNDTGYRWRGRYNEDTDLSLRMLKDGWCTVQFNNFLAHKLETQAIKGGNTEAFYEHEGTLPKSDMLVEMHPDLAKAVTKYGRDHHHVDYSVFKQQLKYKDGLSHDSFKEIDNEYGMITVMTNEEVGDRSKEKYLSELNEIYLKK